MLASNPARVGATPPRIVCQKLWGAAADAAASMLKAVAGAQGFPTAGRGENEDSSKGNNQEPQQAEHETSFTLNRTNRKPSLYT